MPKQRVREVENLIIGGGLAGCITAWILANENKSGALLEKSDNLFGFNGSFEDTRGNFFDLGRHSVDEGRSKLTNEFFNYSHYSQDNDVRKFDLKRGLLLEGTVFPYATPAGQWPEHLKKKLSINKTMKSKIRLGSSRETLAEAYGSDFSNFIFDEVLAAFPTLAWRKSQGAPEHELMDWIFPWFFPLTDLEAPPSKEKEKGVFSSESRSYYYQVRHRKKSEVVLYPTENGFSNWLTSVLNKASEKIEVYSGQQYLQFHFDRKRKQLSRVETPSTVYVPKNVFWCAPLAVLCQTLGWKLPRGEPQCFLIGSFTFEKPLDPPFHEILSGDPNHAIRRISFPDYIAGKKICRTLQIEHLTLKTETDGKQSKQWINDWLRSLISTGIVSKDNDLIFQDLKIIPSGVTTNADLANFSESCHARLSSE